MYLKDFDSFVSNISVINEGFLDNGKTIRRAFIKGGSKVINGVEVDPKEVIETVEDAINSLSFNFGSFFKFVNNFTIIYFWFDKKCSTMCVDDHMNIYISVPFVKFGLKMNKTLIGAVIMHEILHVAFSHLERGNRWLVSNNKPKNEETLYDNNLAADIEVNLALLKKNIITLEELKNEIRGLYLEKFSGNVPPMEVVLEDDEAMEQLRKMCPLKKHDPIDNNKSIETTDEFDEAYVEMKNKITDIVNKYGPEKALEKLREIGVIDDVNSTINDDINFNDVFNLSFLVIKSFEEIINKSKELEEKNGYETKEDGYREAIKKALKEIQSALNPNDGIVDDNNKGGSPKIKTNIKDGDLKPMNLPKHNDGNKSEEKNIGLPTNVNQETGDDDDNNDDKKDGNKNNKSDNDSKNNKNGTDKGFKGDLKKNIEKEGINKDIDTSYGGLKTGEFMDSNSNVSKSLIDTIREDYGDEYEEIENIIKDNIKNNTIEKIEQRKKEAFSRLPQGDALRKLWEEGKKNSEKYKSLWKKILKRFLQKRTRRAGVDVRDKRIKWYDTRRMTVGQISPQNLKKAQDVQDINVYVDVSGSVYSNMELMKLIAQSLVAFLDEYKFSGINVIPWASNSTGVHRVDPISKIGKDKAIEQIIHYIETGASECGGGTNLRGACVPEIVATTFQYKERSKKDDVHIIITDGITSPDEEGIEEYVEYCINNYQKTTTSSLAKNVVKNCIWFLYDNESENWKKNIKQGELVMISSKNFIPTE